MLSRDRKSSSITQTTYDEVSLAHHADTRDPKYRLPWIGRLAKLLPPGAHIGDCDSGPGRDAAMLRARGFQTISMDLSLGMLRAGRKDFPGPRVQSDLRCLPFQSGVFDAIWANACLLHLTSEELPVALGQNSRTLRKSGHLHLSLKKGDGGEWEWERFGKPRWFQYWDEAELDRVLGGAGFDTLEAVTDDLRSQTWIIRQCRKRIPQQKGYPDEVGRQSE